MRDAEAFLTSASKANEALIGIRFAELSKTQLHQIDSKSSSRISVGVDLLKRLVEGIEGRQRGEAIDDETLSMLFALSKKRLVSDVIGLLDWLNAGLQELEMLRTHRDTDTNQAIEVLETVATSTGEEAQRAASKMHVFASEA